MEDGSAQAAAMAMDGTWAAVITIDADCRILFLNAAAESLTGRRAGDAQGRHVCDVLGLTCPPDGGACRWSRTVAGGERRGQPREMTLHPAGCRVDALLGTRSGQGSDGRAAAVLTIVDLTHHRNVEQMRTALVNDVFHELRSPLCSISMAAHFLAADFEDLPPERMRSMLATIQHNASRLLSDLNDLLNRSALSGDEPAVAPRPLDLTLVADQVVWKLQPLLEERGQRVRVDLDTIPLLSADERRVEQVLVNLLTNANKYSVVGDEIVVSAEGQGSMVRVYVEDHGPGLGPTDRERVFDRFYRSDATAETVTGTGLGLAIVRRIVEAHGGRVGVEASAPHGARFWFTLPLAQEDGRRRAVC